jgi:hypothetical protein
VRVEVLEVGRVGALEALDVLEGVAASELGVSDVSDAGRLAAGSPRVGLRVRFAKLRRSPRGVRWKRRW